jgi:DNA-binding beta-propeller fold protein YncE
MRQVQFKRRSGSWLIAWVYVAIAGCGNSTGAPGSPGSSGAEDDAQGGFRGKDSSTSFDAGAGKPDLPPEKEKEANFGAPESSPHFVFIPATDADRVVKISGSTLKVTLVEVGDRPKILRVVPGQDAVLAIDSGSDDVALLRSTETTDDLQFLPILHSNALAMDPSGNYALAWFDLGKAGAGEIGPTAAVSVLRLTPGKTASLTISVGYRPQTVQFTADGKQALVVSADGVSVLNLDALKDGDQAPPVPVSKNPLDKPTEREVLTTPDGKWAVVRQTGKAAVSVVHLPTHWITDVTLDSVPTDLDLVPDGSAALAVLRDSKQVALVPLPADPTTPVPIVADVGELTAGLARITDDGKTAVLYTSVAGIEQVATLDLKTMKVQPFLLRKTVDYVFLPAGSRKAILVHKPAPGPGNADDPVEATVDASEGYTLFDLDTGYTKLVLTPVKLTEIATSHTPDKAWLLLPDPAGLTHLVQAVDLASFLTQDFGLGSPPEHVRDLPLAGVVAVTQTHPTGRITFIGSKTGEAKTVTGYELNALVK